MQVRRSRGAGGKASRTTCRSTAIRWRTDRCFARRALCILSRSSVRGKGVAQLLASRTTSLGSVCRRNPFGTIPAVAAAHYVEVRLGAHDRLSLSNAPRGWFGSRVHPRTRASSVRFSSLARRGAAPRFSVCRRRAAPRSGPHGSGRAVSQRADRGARPAVLGLC